MSIPTRLKGFLDENQIPYSALTHAAVYTAQGAAATMQISGKELAKTVVLWAGEEMILAVLPAPNHVRLDKLGAELGKSVRLATEQEFSSLFPDCELGAMPVITKNRNVGWGWQYSSADGLGAKLSWAHPRAFVVNKMGRTERSCAEFDIESQRRRQTLRSDPLILRRCLSSLSPVAMVQADDLRNGYDAALLRRFHGSRFWRILGQRQVRARVLVVSKIALQNPA